MTIFEVDFFERPKTDDGKLMLRSSVIGHRQKERKGWVSKRDIN